MRFAIPWLLLVSVPAWAQASAEKPSLLLQIVPFGLMFVIFYFFIIRPQSQRQKQQQEFLTSLKRGDEVLTSGGIFGTIEGLTERFVTLEVADGVRIRVLRSQVSASSKEVKND